MIPWLLKFSIERGKKENESYTIKFLDVKIIVHNYRHVETEIFYTSTNNHHYLEYSSFHPQHINIKDNIPFSMARKIIVFATNSTKEARELERL